jgi:hypothetical protein
MYLLATATNSALCLRKHNEVYIHPARPGRNCESVRKDAVESRLDESVQGLAEPAIGINEPAAVIGEPQIGSRTCTGVLEKGESGGLVQFAQPSPRMSVGHSHALSSTPQRSQPVDCLEQVSLAVAE